MTSGIYSITSPSGKFYIGSAVDFNKRWAVHRSLLKKGSHHSRGLQRAATKYGLDKLTFCQVLICCQKDLIFYEQLLLDGLNPTYNSNPIAGSCLGAKFSQKTKDAMSAARVGVRQTAEHIQKRTAKLLGARRSPEAIARYVAMRNRSVRCVENSLIFVSGKDAADWCMAQGLTKSQNGHVSINRAIRLNKSAFGLHWKLIK